MNDFKTVKIGKQTWMAENLAIDDDGEGITYNEENGEYYYTWEAAMRVAKSIPGWHLPSVGEWSEAVWACGTIEDPHKNNPNHNDYEDVQSLKDKLSVKLAGCYSGSFLNVGSGAYFWSSTEDTYSTAYGHHFRSGTSLGSNYDDEDYGYSVRLVKDSTDNPNHDNPTDSLEVRIAELEAENKKLKAELRKQKAWDNYEATDNGWV